MRKLQAVRHLQNAIRYTRDPGMRDTYEERKRKLEEHGEGG